MQQIEYLEEIAGKLEKKYTGFVEIYRLTKELDDLLKNNDRDSVNMVMKMRGEEMNKISVIDEDINRACSLISAQYRKYINNYNDFDSFPEELERIISIKKRNRRVLEKIIEIDKRISVRLAGNKSFYSI